jgi:Sigma-70, region 4
MNNSPSRTLNNPLRSYASVAAEMGVSIQRVRHLEQRALKKLRIEFNKLGLGCELKRANGGASSHSSPPFAVESL